MTINQKLSELKHKKAINEEEYQKLHKLTKYERAFEILKDKMEMGLEIERSDFTEEYWILQNGCNIELNYNEYKLLEELMKGE